MFAGKCLFLSGLVPRPMNAENDKELLSYGIGFTNIVERTTRANQELSRQEIEEGKALSIVVIEVKQTEPPRVCCILSSKLSRLSVSSCPRQHPRDYPRVSSCAA